MSRAVQCDRCGKCYSEGVDDSHPTLEIHELGVPMDLCDECYEQLVTWFDDKKEVNDGN